MGPITPLGKKWEFNHSIWLAWLLVPFGFASYISFFYIAARAKKKKWFVAGIIYLLFFIQYIYFSDNYPIDHPVFTMSMIVLLFAWIASCVHAFLARREYLRIIAWRKEHRAMKEHEQREKARARAQEKQERMEKERKNRVAKEVASAMAQIKQSPPIHINEIDVNDLAQIVGESLAKEIIAIRKNIEGFNSLPHFIQMTNVKPHIIANMQKHIYFSTEFKEEMAIESTTRSGRVVDY